MAQPNSAYPVHTFLSQLDEVSQASALQYESAVNAFLAKAFNPDGTLQSSAVWRAGSIRMVAYDDVADDLADGWLRTDGTIYGITSYPGLFARIGNRWGGDGISTFAVPNDADAMVLGYGSSATLGTAVGVTGGAINHTHTINAESAHTHAVSGTTSSNGAHNHTGATGTGGPTGADDVCGATVNPFFAVTAGSADHTHPISTDGAHTHTYSSTSGAGSAHTHTEGGANQKFLVYKGLIKT